MATSGSTNYVSTRDDIIKRALRILGVLGQGETPTTEAVTEAAHALNDIIKEWQADGMQLWKIAEYTVTLLASIGDYSIGVGQTLDTPAPLKVLQAFRRTGTTPTTDTPMIILSRYDWNLLPNKNSSGTPTHIFYETPGATDAAAGLLHLWPAPTQSFIDTPGSIVISYSKPLEDFDASTDNPDIPSYYTNALVWGLADQLAYEYGTPITDRAQISKKAQGHKLAALSFDQEEGSLFFRPDQSFGDW